MVICCVGDSLTQGIGDELALGWVGRLAQFSFAKVADRARTFTVCNLGLRGDSSVRIAERWREETERRRRPGEAMAYVFCFGAADGKYRIAGEETLSAAREILSQASGLGTTLFITPGPAKDPHWSAHIRWVGEAVGGICGELGVPVFDLYAPLSASAGYMASLAADGIHPDAAGYGQMAHLLRGWPPLAQLLGL